MSRYRIRYEQFLILFKCAPRIASLPDTEIFKIVKPLLEGFSTMGMPQIVIEACINANQVNHVLT